VKLDAPPELPPWPSNPDRAEREKEIEAYAAADPRPTWRKISAQYDEYGWAEWNLCALPLLAGVVLRDEHALVFVPNVRLEGFDIVPGLPDLDAAQDAKIRALNFEMSRLRRNAEEAMREACEAQAKLDELHFLNRECAALLLQRDSEILQLKREVAKHGLTILTSDRAGALSPTETGTLALAIAETAPPAKKESLLAYLWRLVWH